MRESNPPLENRHGIYVVLILGLAAALRIYGLNWSLPHTYEEATPLRVAISMWGWQHDGPITLNPQFFNYPSLTFYIHFVAQGLVFLVLRLAGEIKSATDWYVLYLTNPTAQYLGARLVGVCFGVATIFFTYKIARFVTTSQAALLAALLDDLPPAVGSARGRLSESGPVDGHDRTAPRAQPGHPAEHAQYG